MTTKRIMRWGIVLFLLAALPVMTAVMAQEQEPATQLPVVMERGESSVTFTWSNTETEPNNISSRADDWCGDWGMCGGVHGGIISSASDVDYWEVYVSDLPYEDSGQWESVNRDNFPMLIDIEAQSIGSPLDSDICLYSDDGYELACNNNTDSLDSMLYYNFEVTNSENPRHYYLAVRAHNGSGAGANAKYQLLISTPYLFSASAKNLGAATVEGITFQAGDILAYSEYSGGHKWVMLLDLSDLGVKGNITSLSSGWRNSDFLLVGFAANVTLPGIARPVTPWEVVVFDPTQVGPSTQGTFAFFWDGRAQGLTTTAEKPDAIDWPNWNGTTRLIASTVGNASVYGGPGPALKLPDEDVGLWGEGSPARWSRFFDTSGVAPAYTDVIAFSYSPYSYVDGSADTWDYKWGHWYMVVQSASGSGVTQKDVILLVAYSHEDPGDPSNDHSGWYSTIWRGPAHGWNYNIDAIQMQRTVWGMQ